MKAFWPEQRPATHGLPRKAWISPNFPQALGTEVFALRGNQERTPPLNLEG